MPAPVMRRAGLAAVALVAALQGQPLRKSDLIRLLSGSTFSQDEIAAMVRRTCLSFTPSSRDRADFTSLGASPVVLREIDACTRRAQARAAAPPVVRRAPAPVAPPTVTPSPITRPAVTPPAAVRVPAAAPSRTGFVGGTSQHGTVGTKLPLPLVFQALDEQGAPVRAQAVAFTARNARVDPAGAVTDSGGRARVEVTLGAEVRAAVVTATIGLVAKSVSFTPAPGPPAELVVLCRGERAEDRLALPVDSPTVLLVSARDAFGNAAAVAGGLRAAVGDRHILRVRDVRSDSGGSVTLEPVGQGSTALQLQWSGVRVNFTATVAPGPARRGC